MILFHGSNQVVSIIDLKKCKPYKDFGLGFYLTIHTDQARRMAVRTANIYGGIPLVSKFEYDEEAASGLNIKIFDNPTADWAHFVMNNRNKFYKDIASTECNTDGSMTSW